jgi:fluoroacetyl-CoA thioesterase
MGQHQSTLLRELMTVALAAGLRGEARIDAVQSSDLAEALGSGDVAVLGTPRVLALAETATVAAVAPALAAEETSVGVSVRLRHLAPTLLGAWVTASAELVACERRRLQFRVEVRDAGGLIAEGEIERAIVNRASFLAAAQARTSK